MRAKFNCDSVEDIGTLQTDVTLSAVASDENIENQSFNKATPYAKLEMMIDNPDARGFFQVGKEYYLDFIQA